MATVLFFGPLADLAHCRRVELKGRTVAELIGETTRLYGESFETALASCAIWVNGEPVTRTAAVDDVAEVAFLPPVSGG